jgi:hypothetical protein
MLVRFDSLPEAVRRRLAEILGDPRDPRVVFWQSGHAVRWLYLPFGLVGALAASVCLRLGLGLERPDLATVLGAVPCLFVALLTLSHYLYRRLWPGLPLRSGYFVFPSAVVATASSTEIRVIPTVEVTAVKQVDILRGNSYTRSHVAIHGSQPDDRVELWFGSSKRAQAALEKIRAGQLAYREALAAHDSAKQEAMDPLHECSSSGRWSVPPQTPIAGPVTRQVPSAAKVGRWVGSGVLSLVPLLFFAPAMSSYRVSQSRRAAAAALSAQQAEASARQARTTHLDRVAASPAAARFLAGVADWARRQRKIHLPLCIVHLTPAELETLDRSLPEKHAPLTKLPNVTADLSRAIENPLSSAFSTKLQGLAGGFPWIKNEYCDGKDDRTPVVVVTYRLAPTQDQYRGWGKRSLPIQGLGASFKATARLEAGARLPEQGKHELVLEHSTTPAARGKLGHAATGPEWAYLHLLLPQFEQFAAKLVALFFKD